MRKFKAAAAIGAMMLASGSALAADLPTPTVNEWTGFYIGLQAGYSWMDTNGGYDHNDPGSPYPDNMKSFNTDLQPSGVVLGGQVGADYQFDNNVVIGAEFSAAYLGLEDKMNDQLARYFNPSSNDTISSDVNFQALLTARLGYAIGSTLPYVKGGYSWANSEFKDTQGPHKIENTLGGWALGGGVEQKLTEHISAKVEYMHVWYDEETYFNGQAYQASSEPSQNTITAAVNYRF